MSPDILWHEAHPWHMQPDRRSHPEPCAHAVVGGTPAFLHVARGCGSTEVPPSLGAAFVKVRRAVVVEGRGAEVRVLFNGSNGMRDVPVLLYARRPPTPASSQPSSASKASADAAWADLAAMWDRYVAQRSGPSAWALDVARTFADPLPPFQSWDDVPREHIRSEMLRAAARLTGPRPADLRALGLRKAPDKAALTAAWRATAKRLHPDHGGSTEKFIAAREAFERVELTVVDDARLAARDAEVSR